MSEPDDESHRLDLLATRPSARLDVRVVTLDANSQIAYDPADWTDAIIEVDAGTIEIETRDGATIQFPSGSVLWLIGLPVRTLRNPTTTPAILITASRRQIHQPSEATHLATP